jgi:hypothetical protein
MLCSTSNLTAMLLSRPHVLDDATARRAALELDVSLRAATESPLWVPASRPRRASAGRPAVPAGPRSRATRTHRKRSASPAKALLIAGVLLAFLGVGAPVGAALGQGIAHLLTGDLVKEDPPPVKEVHPSKPAHPQRTEGERKR